jgi:hypothetical protein
LLFELNDTAIKKQPARIARICGGTGETRACLS